MVRFRVKLNVKFILNARNRSCLSLIWALNFDVGLVFVLAFICISVGLKIRIIILLALWLAIALVLELGLELITSSCEN